MELTGINTEPNERNELFQCDGVGCECLCVVCIFMKRVKLKTAKHWSEMYACVGERIKEVEREYKRNVRLVVCRAYNGFWCRFDGCYCCCCYYYLLVVVDKTTVIFVVAIQLQCYWYGCFCRQHERVELSTTIHEILARYKNIHTLTSIHIRNENQLSAPSKLGFLFLLLTRFEHIEYANIRHHDKSAILFISSVTGKNNIGLF